MKHTFPARALVHAGLLSAALVLPVPASLADPLERPAQASSLAGKRLINGLTRAGDKRLVAAGQRGHILFSDDAGQSWQQAQVPLSSDLTALQFPDARTGYAVGHDGVVLKSSDGGQRWTRLLDGRKINALVLEHMSRSGNAELLAEAKRNAEAGPDKPLLDLWFKSPDEGFVVGAYNLILRTTDGGKSWEPWFDRTDNPRLLNLYAIRPQGEALFIAGESGLLLRLDAGGQRFEAVESPYKGSFFGLLPTPGGLIAYGMRGHAFHSADLGRSWQRVETGLAASITAADLGPGGEVLLADQGGRLALSTGSEMLSFRRIAPKPALPAAAVLLQGKSGAILGGPRGLQAAAL